MASFYKKMHIFGFFIFAFVNVCCLTLKSNVFRKASLSMSYYKGSRSGGGSGGGSYRGGGSSYRGRGGGGGRSDRNRPDPFDQLRFTKTIKIDPNLKTPLEEMNFSERTLRILKEKGFEFMTPVQSQSYDYVYEGSDVVARSRTGTGKTFAFGLPLIEKLASLGENEKRQGLPLVLILEPTRELALQVAQELNSVCFIHRMRVQAMYGGSSFGQQEQALRSGLHIVVATPGRALDHITRGTMDLSNVKHVVLDEGDTMLEMGFQKSVESIIANVKKPGEESRRAAAKSLERMESRDRDGPSSRYSEPDEEEDEDYDYDDDEEDSDDQDPIPRATKSNERSVQMLLFSATMPGWICKLTDKHMIRPIFLDAVQEGENRLASTITHLAMRMPATRNRLDGIKLYIEDLILTKGAGGQTIIFTNTKDEADELSSSSSLGQLKTQVIHGDISQGTRQSTIRAFKMGNIDVLIATDVAARGLDIAGVDLVINTAMPADYDTYVHRSGRTGRAGRNGTAIVLYTAPEEHKLRTLENILKFKFTKCGPPSAKDICEASALIASKKIESVDSSIVKYFIPHARTLLKSFARRDRARGLGEAESDDFEGVLSLNEEEGCDDEDVDDGSIISSPAVEKLLARCIAAVCNKNSITSRSLLSGEENTMTLQIEAVFKNGSTPDNTRDWQKLVSGVLRRSFEMEDTKFTRFSMAKLPNTNTFCALFDLPSDVANEIIEAFEDELVILPQGIKISNPEFLPLLVHDRFSSDYESTGGSSGGYRGGAGSYRGDRGSVNSGGDRPRSSGSWSPRGGGGGGAARSWRGGDGGGGYDGPRSGAGGGRSGSGYQQRDSSSYGARRPQ